MNSAAFGQHTRSLRNHVQHLRDDLGAQAGVICYSQNGGASFIYGRPSFVEVVNKFVNKQAPTPIVAMHRALALVQLDDLNEVQIGDLLNRVDVLIDSINAILTANDA